MPELSEPENYYRYEDRRHSICILGPGDCEEFSSQTYLTLRTLPVLSRTKTGVWLDTGMGTKRFVTFAATRRFADRTEDDARRSFIKRKQKQIEHVKKQLKHLQTAVNMAENRIGI